MAAGQVSDCTDAAALLGSLPKAEWLLADRSCDADWFREALKNKGIYCEVAEPQIHHMNAARGLAARARLPPRLSFIRTPSPGPVDPPRYLALVLEARIRDGAPFDAGEALGKGDLPG